MIECQFNELSRIAHKWIFIVIKYQKINSFVQGRLYDLFCLILFVIQFFSIFGWDLRKLHTNNYCFHLSTIFFSYKNTLIIKYWFLMFFLGVIC